ncbi:gp033 [Rhodococcus phage ReqiDocB7]|uniref:gp033 n=1 Tax=Rhodococcus phage ReqiDocB7 TaxID=691966 RepID=UPI0001CDD763|nr:gp033 [Rhodococcus phage ReqiDocB7]ADD80819.1 gp033 [Rhodococcus phage ReqiDocB7]
MQLYSISASRFESFIGCSKRYWAEYIKRVPRSENGGPADTGTACHLALELYVQAVHIKKTHEPSQKLLLEFFHEAFKEVFKFSDRHDERYKDGVSMLKNWFKRSDNLARVRVISTELKSHIMIKTNDGLKKYNYVWDCCHEFWENVVTGEVSPTPQAGDNWKHIIRVVDYKSYRKNLSNSDVKEKLQFKMYAVAASIQFKDSNADEIWVMSDMLRYGEVQVKYTVEECRESWKDIRETANIILAMDEKDVEETIHDGCTYCPLKATCKTLKKNAENGGTWSHQTDDDLLRALYEANAAEKANKYAAGEIKKIIDRRAQEMDIDRWETDNFTVEYKSKASRQVDTRQVGLIVGPEVMQTIAKVNVSSVDALIKSNELGDEKSAQLKEVFSMTYSDPNPSVSLKG